MPIVLFIDDDQNLLDGIARSMRRERFTVVTCLGVVAARSRLEQGDIDVVVSDESMPGASGSDFLAEVRQHYPTTMRIMLTGNASIGSAARAVNGGEIFRFLVKPCGHAELADTLRKALEQKALHDRCRTALRVLQRQNAVLLEIEKLHRGVVAEAVRAAASMVQVEPELQDKGLLERMDVAIVRAQSAVGG